MGGIIGNSMYRRGYSARGRVPEFFEHLVLTLLFGSMMFGIGTKNARLHVDAFVNMLGETDESWGLSHKGILWHGGNYRQYTKSFKENISTTIGK